MSKSKSKFFLFVCETDKSFKDFAKKGKPSKNFVFFKTMNQVEKHYFDNFFLAYRDSHDDDLDTFYLNGGNPDDVHIFFEKTNGKRFVIETYFGL